MTYSTITRKGSKPRFIVNNIWNVILFNAYFKNNINALTKPSAISGYPRKMSTTSWSSIKRRSRIPFMMPWRFSTERMPSLSIQPSAVCWRCTIHSYASKIISYMVFWMRRLHIYVSKVLLKVLMECTDDLEAFS